MTETDVDRLLAHADWLRALARRLVGPADADDVVQDTLITAMRSPPDRERPPRPWLGQVLRNVARMRFRASARRTRHEEAAVVAPGAATDPASVVERLEAQRALCELLIGLAEPYRSTLVLHYYDGLTLVEISRRNGIAEATVRWRHKHALEQLRARLDERCGGDRRAWLGSLAPIATSPLPAAPLLAGGLLVNKLAIGAIAAVAAAGLIYGIARPGADAPSAATPAPTAAPPGPRITFGQPKPSPTGELASIHGGVRGADRARITLVEIAGDAPITVDEQAGARFDFRGIRAGTYCVVATAGPLAGSTCDIAIGPGERVEREIELARPEARLHGTVSDAGGGAISRPRVVVQRFPRLDRMATSQGDDAGRYDVALAPGTFRVTVQADGYIASQQLVEVAGDRQLDVQLNPGATIAGRVVDDEGQPVAGAKVNIAGVRAVGTDASGRFAITGLRPGRFDVVAFAEPRVSDVQSVNLLLGETLELQLVLRDTGATLEGHAIDDGGRPVERCRIDVRGPIERTATTDAAGRFRLAGLAPGRYEVAAHADGFARATTSTVVGHGEASELALRLSRGVTVSGHVRTSTGRGVAGATVASSAWNLDDPRLDVHSGAQGEFRLGPLPPGAVRLSAFHPAHGVSNIVVVELAPGASPTAELVFDATAAIEGVVRLDDGTPASGALVGLDAHDSPARWSLAADRDGRFTIAALPSGQYDIGARPAVSALAQTIADAGKTVELTAGKSTRVELEIPGGRERISGRVVDADGKPVPAGVWAERADRVRSPPSLDDVRIYALSDGSFELADLQRGSYTIYAAHPAHATGKLVDVPAGTRGVTIVLPGSPSVAGRVVQHGRPVRSFRVQWTWISRSGGAGRVSSQMARMVNDPDGRFQLDQLEPTPRITVSVQTSTATGATPPFALVAGERRTDLAIELAGTGTVRGRLVDRTTGRPALGLEVLFEEATLVWVPVDGAGRFAARIPAGEYRNIWLQSQTRGYRGIERAFAVRSGESTELGDLPVDLQ